MQLFKCIFNSIELKKISRRFLRNSKSRTCVHCRKNHTALALRMWSLLRKKWRSAAMIRVHAAAGRSIRIVVWIRWNKKRRIIWSYSPRNSDKSILTGVARACLYCSPASECWPEEEARQLAVLRRSRGGRRWWFFWVISSGERILTGRNCCSAKVFFRKIVILSS